MNNLKVIDLFCGCGGFSSGFEQLNFDVLGIDIWPVCLQAHQGHTIQKDLTTLERTDLPSSFQNPDIIIGSPPCQVFSTANRHTRTKDDKLIKHFKRIVAELKPRYWIWENVMGSRSVETGEILDAQNFGLAQRRKRNFVANFDISPKYMKKYHLSPITVRQVLPNILGIGLLDGYNSTIYSLDSVSPTIRRIPLKWYDGRYSDENGKLIPPHDKRLRFTGFKMLTIEDHLILMGFDPNMMVYGNKGDKMLQIGNAVSPVVSKAIAERILELW